MVFFIVNVDSVPPPPTFRRARLPSSSSATDSDDAAVAVSYVESSLCRSVLY